MDRNTGKTTQQIARLKHCGIFVWCNRFTYYPEQIAKKLHREDVQIKPLSWLRCENVYGRRFTDIDVDHAVWAGPALSEDMMNALEYARTHLPACPAAGVHLTRPVHWPQSLCRDERASGTGC